MAAPGKRIALLGLSIECNKWAPPSTKADFLSRTYLSGEALMEDARAAAPVMQPETPGFVSDMDASGPWTPVPILLAMTEPGGPIEHGFFEEFLGEIETGLRAALPVDGVYICSHGAAITTESEDPDGTLFRLVRRIVGPTVPIVATLDLHANISDAMVDFIDVFIGYRTNPHVDMRECGVEAAEAMRELFAGTRPKRAFIRLPIVPPTVTMLTAGGPYADLINYGAAHKTARIMNVSVMGGFAFGDTSKNGLAVVVTAREDARAAHDLAVDIAHLGWKNRERFRTRLTALADALAMALAAGREPTRPALIFADVADNPGGGARGNTTYLLEALHQAGAKSVLLGVFNDPALAAEAHRLGEGAAFRARFNRDETNEFSKPFAADARVLKLSDGSCIGRRGTNAGLKLELGPSAAIMVGGITVVVITQRTQCCDPIFFEMFGLDIAKARSVVVKSRGHFRAGFDEFFKPEQVIEVDLPGLTSPVLSRFDWQRLPRPVLPIDENVVWSPPPFRERDGGAP
ncbi:MAG: M81 family metallopeptidase [Proteobacteria bacterium]|nr:M81 family metallopeptidase [Pseudomonadota bacterium]MBI3495852.1 M81 family metallopeptidase [Pseudomonadota bacterium]